MRAGIVSPMRRRLALAAAASLAFGLAGCGSDAESANPSTALATARTTLDSATAVTLDLKSDQAIPSGHNGVSAAKGTGIVDATTPKFKGTVTAVIEGAPFNGDVITIGDTTWMTLFGAGYTEVDVAELGAPDPGSFFRPESGLSSLLAEVGSPAGGEEERYGREVLAKYTGTVPGSVVKNLLNLGTPEASFDAEFGILPETGELRTAELTGPFYETGDSTYTLVLTDYGTTIDIAEP